MNNLNFNFEIINENDFNLGRDTYNDKNACFFGNESIPESYDLVGRVKDIETKDKLISSFIHNVWFFLANSKDTEIKSSESYFTSLCSTIENLKIENLYVHLPSFGEEKKQKKCAENLIRALYHNLYSFSIKKENTPKHSLKNIYFFSNIDILAVVNEATTIAKAENFARDLGNQPANWLNPDKFAEISTDLAKKHNLKIEILGQKELEAEKMFSLLSVSQGGPVEPKLVVIHYTGNPTSQNLYTLVGKGVCFDSGGISLKPGRDMHHMKFDMSGAGAVLASFKMAVEAKLPINLSIALPCVENLPSGLATKPGDVVVSKEGLTIEIQNTDAEGRLILADAITYMKKYKPTYLVDVATLTGAMSVALGSLRFGVFSNSDELSKKIELASNESEQLSWRMPLDKAYEEDIKSSVADLSNIGKGSAGSIIGGVFLHQFAKDIAWAHLDIANIAYKGDKSTGKPVWFLSKFLINLANENN